MTAKTLDTLPAATVLGAGDVVLLRQGGVSKKADVALFTAGGGAVTSVAGRTGAVVLASADVGLANVDNTADASKPVSTAQASAISAAQAAAIAASAHPANHPPSIIAQDASNRFVTDTEKATWNAKQPAGAYLTGNQTITFTGGATGSGTTAVTLTLSNTAVTGQVLTGYVSGAGTVAATDSILQAIQKLNGNAALKANINSPTFTGTVGGITAAMVGAPAGSGNSTGTNTGDGAANGREFLHSSRDFVTGTLITTSIALAGGEPWYLEIKGNGYQNSPAYDVIAQGYIYAPSSTVALSSSAFSKTSAALTNIYAFGSGGFLCFWFTRQGYWQGFDVRCVVAYPGCQPNKVVSITDAALPGARTWEAVLNALPIATGTNTGDNATNSQYAADYRAANFVAGTDYIAPTGSIAANTGLTSGQVVAALGYTPSAAISRPAVVISTNTTAVSGAVYVLTASLTLTLPASPSAGEYVMFANRSSTTTATIARNGQNIMGLAEDMTIDGLHYCGELMFADATRGWVLL